MSNWAFPAFPLHAIPVPTHDFEPQISEGQPHGQQRVDSSMLQANHTSSSNIPHQPQVASHNAEAGYEGDQDEDPRNATRKARNRIIKSVEANLLHTMIRMFLQEKGLYLTKEAMMDGKRFLDANIAVVDAYMDKVGPGPSNEDPRFAWERPATHPWNRKVVYILASDFKTYASTTGITQLVKLLGAGKEGGTIGDYGAAIDKITDIEIVIADKLADQQCRYRTLMRKMGSLTGLSELEVKKTLKDNLHTSQQASRRNERKRNRYLQRATIIAEQLVQATSSPTNTKFWQDLELIFSHFREEDMSSDDTETERTFHAGKTVRCVRKFWISNEATKILHFIDKNYSPRTLRGSRKRGSGPLKRELASLCCNALHPAPPHLPINFYNLELGEERIQTLEALPSMKFPEISTECEQSSTSLADEMDAD